MSKDVDVTEITNIIYDTLMQNKHHPQLLLEDVENAENVARLGIITFEYFGKYITIQINSNKIK